jgi:RNA polymerase sigma factor (sigma-70 family)
MTTLDQLEDQQREVVTLRIWSELTWAEIAELMETSSSSAHRTYATAIARMKELLETSCLTKRI